MKIKKIIKSKMIWAPLAAILLVQAWFVFWNLGVGSLQPWDEAWYGEISRNILSSHNPWVLTYNQAYYFDHPPLGFQLRAISQAIFGGTTFAVRLPEAIVSLASLVLIYLIAKSLSSSWAGTWAAIMLGSSRWFLFRSRTGNFDVLLLFSQLAVVYMLVKVMFNKTKQLRQNDKWLWLAWLMLGISLLTKSMISLQLFPLLIWASVVYWRKVGYQINQRKFWLSLLGCLAALVLPLLPWIVSNLLVDSREFLQTQQRIGLRSGTDKSFNFSYLQTMVLYFHAAVHRWFKIILVGFLAAVGLLLTKFRQQSLFLLSLCFLVAAPYVISEKTEIWHLIPAAGVSILLAGVSIDRLITLKLKKFTLALKILFTLFMIGLATVSYRDYWHEFMASWPFPQDYEKITRHISHKSEKVYVTSDAYFPAIVFYANLDNAPVEYLSDDGDILACQRAIKGGEHLQIIARYGDWVMDRLGEDAVSAREGELVFVELDASECATYLNARSQAI